MACAGCSKNLQSSMKKMTKIKPIKSIQVKMGAMKGTKMMNPGKQNSGKHSATVAPTWAQNGRKGSMLGRRGGH